MTQQLFAPSTVLSTLPDVFSQELVQLVNTLQPSVVQVRNEGRGSGTGVIVSADGRIITNHHVVPSDKGQIQVQLWDERILDAKVIDRNPQMDIALLKVTADDLPPARLGDSAALRVGNLVFAIGNPFGQRGVVTAGIVSSFPSAQDGEGEGDEHIRYIKSDVGLAPGNSGGPLLNADGEVVGINAMIFGGDLAVTIPSNVVRSWTGQLPKRDITLGIELQPVGLNGALSKELADGREQALMVVSVGSQQEADVAKTLLIGDVLLSIAGKPVTDVASVEESVARSTAEALLSIRVIRAGAVMELHVVTKALEHTP